MGDDRGGGETRRTASLALLAFVVAVLVVYGGYDRHWSWVGINGRTATLWDWLHLLLLPLAAVALPVWLRTRPAVRATARGVLGVVAGVFVVIVIAGYAVPWAWTGFSGNRLWDWLNLGALPLAVALIPVIIELRAGWRPRHTATATVAAAAFVVVVLGGYLAPWRWTGFTGNTVWDWLHLLLLPLLVPVAIVPALTPALKARMGALDQVDPETGGADASPGASAEEMSA